ncbi:hypothetical protein BJ875DRAFT_286865 [Amylocarpus encephaloides]|uniref:WSC domain-containing protein n=1 Tax=Amylocarpus encephaloides TaxID=45428 RepID=A0A9P8C9X3_9HELO|nr:hypothetical protein BJ875DRAFT_286865 [Amylocarpus encephaloides]
MSITMSIFLLSCYFSLLTLHLILPFTLTQSITSTPTSPMSPLPPNYTLLGCYLELPRGSGGRAIGLTGQYLSPLPPDVVTVPRCLDACANARQPDGTRQYPYAALENSRGCFCGLTFSNSSMLSDPSNCQSPCSGDQNTTCGGFGFLELYQFIITRPELSSNFSVLTTNPTTTNDITNETPSATANPTTIPISSPSSPPHSSSVVGLAVGISFGVFFFTLIVAVLVTYVIYRYKRRKSSDLQGNLTPTQFAGLPFSGGSRFEASYAGDGDGDEEESDQFFNEESSEVDHGGGEDVEGHEAKVDTNKAKPRAAFLDKDHIIRNNKDKGKDMGATAGMGENCNPKKITRRRTFEAWKSGVVPSGPPSTISTIDLNRDSIPFPTFELRSRVDIRRSQSYTEGITRVAQTRDVGRARELGRQARSAGSSLVELLVIGAEEIDAKRGRWDVEAGAKREGREE